MAEYRYYDGSEWVWGITDAADKYFKNAVCKAGVDLHIKNYCTGIGVDTHCTDTPCDFVIKH